MPISTHDAPPGYTCLADASASSRLCVSPLVRVSKKPEWQNRGAVLFRLWENCLVLLLAEKVEVADVLAIQLPGDSDHPGAVVVGVVDQLALREDEAWMVSCVLRNPLSRDVVAKTPTLFVALCELEECDKTVPLSATRNEPRR